MSCCNFSIFPTSLSPWGYYASSSCFFIWLLHMTAFPALLTLDARRAGANPPRLDPFACIAARSWGTGGRGDVTDVVHVCLAGDILIVGETYISLGYNQMNEFNDPPPAATQVFDGVYWLEVLCQNVLRSQGWWCRIFPYFFLVIHSESSHWMAEIARFVFVGNILEA